MQQYDKHDLLQKKNELAAAKKLRKWHFLCDPCWSYLAEFFLTFFSSQHNERGAKIVKICHQFLRRYFC
jgi:hypothetical protein